MPLHRGRLRYGAVDSGRLKNLSVKLEDIAEKQIIWFDIVTLWQAGVYDLKADIVQELFLKGSRFTIPTDFTKHAIQYTWMVGYELPSTAQGYLELFDETTSSVLATTPLRSAGVAVYYDTYSFPTLTEGNTVGVRLRITVAGGAGEVVRLFRSWILVKKAVK